MMNYDPNGPQQPGYHQGQPGPYPSGPGYPPPGYPQMPPQQPVQPPKKKKGCLIASIIAGVIVGAVVLCGVIAAITSGGKGSSTTTPSSPGNSNGGNQQQAPGKQGTWQTTHTFTGNGAKKTESFTVGGDWKIQWSCNPGSIGIDAPLFITVYKTQGNVPLDMGNQTTCKAGQDTKGETEEHEGGTVYLNVNSGIDWTIEVQELK